jgi:ATP phosphoribosyltransferase regulatory subunit
MAAPAPAQGDAGLQEKIAALRAEGHIVIQALPDTGHDVKELNCDRKLAHYNSGWHVLAIDSDKN